MLALITGANRGIGRSTALQLARDGVDIILTYRTHADEAADVVAEIEALGRTARALPLDTGDVASFPAPSSPALGDTRIDYLVNNAGMAIGGAFGEVDEADFDRLVDVHFKGVFFLTQALLPLLADGGAIVNLSTGLTRFTGPAARGLRLGQGRRRGAHPLPGARSSARAASPSTRSPRAPSPPTSATACCATTPACGSTSPR